VSREELSAWVIAKAREIGFDLCGVSPAAEFDELARLPEWIARGYAGEMKYLRDPRREDPARVVEGARSVIVVALNYLNSQPYSTEVPPPLPDEAPRGWVSRYAWGDDYHDVLGAKLEQLLAAMRAELREPFDARAYVDTGPILERIAARHAGFGWLAKNTMLINEQFGSWLFLGVIVTTLDLAPSVTDAAQLPADQCGNCRLCLDACPTDAFPEAYVLDARRCISYLTIELRGAIPEELRAPMGRMVFGCDICQDVCPWNRNAPVAPLADFLPRKSPIPLFAPAFESLAAITEASFRESFRGSPIKRTKWRGLVRNACVALGNAKLSPDTQTHQRVCALLDRLAASPDEVVADHARWALDRLRAPRPLTPRPANR
jgi:epoxyqueuosine reductase